MTWAQRLKRVFGIEIDSCGRCGGKLKVIASIEEPEVICATEAQRGEGRTRSVQDRLQGRAEFEEGGVLPGRINRLAG